MQYSSQALVDKSTWALSFSFSRPSFNVCVCIFYWEEGRGWGWWMGGGGQGGEKWDTDGLSVPVLFEYLAPFIVYF